MRIKPESTAPANSSPFYVTGGTLRGDAASYVQRQADETLFTSLVAGEFCYVLDARQMGKSSLMIRTAARLEAEGITVIKLDLTSVGLDLSSEQWYFGLLEGLGCGLDAELEAFWNSHQQLGPLQRWFKAIEDVLLPRTQGRVVIFVDEIDIVRSLPFRTDEFFAGIRECYNRRASEGELRRLAFCLLGVTTPSELIRDVVMTPFNIGTRIELSDFTPHEAALLAQGLSGEGRDGAELLDRVLFWTGGHPYLTQKLCRAVADAKEASSDGEVDRLCADLFLSPRAQKQDNNLIFVRARLLDGDVASLLELYGRVHANKRIEDDDTDPLVDHLRLSGIVRSISGCLQVRNRIYFLVFDREWVRTNMPDAEVRRQRAAYRRGLIRAGSASGVVLLVIAGLALSLLFQKRLSDANAARARKAESRTREEADRSSRLLYVADMNLIPQDWKINNLGHMQTLLEETRGNPARGFEWDYWHRLANQFWMSVRTEGLLHCAAFAPGGRLITASTDRTATVWDIATRRALHVLKGHTDTVTSVSVSRDGRWIATGSRDGTAKLWDGRTGHLHRTLAGHKWMVVHDFTPDGKRVLTTDFESSVKLWDVETGSVVFETKAPWEPSGKRPMPSFIIAQIRKPALSPDGRRIATCELFYRPSGSKSNVRIWDLRTGHETALIPNATLPGAFSPDGRRFVSAGMDDREHIWDAESGREVVRLEGSIRHAMIPHRTHTVAFTPDGKKVLAACHHLPQLRLWDAQTGSIIPTSLSDEGTSHWTAFSPGGERYLTCGDDHMVRVFDTASRRQLLSLPHQDIVIWARFSPDGRYIVSHAGKMETEDTITLWDTRASYNESQLLHGDNGPIHAMVLSPDSRRLAVAGATCDVRVWDIRSGRTFLLLRGHTGPVRSDAWSRGGRRLVTGSEDGTAKVWDTTVGRVLIDLRGHRAAVLQASFAPDGQRIITGSRDGTVRLWDALSGRAIQTLAGHRGTIWLAAFSPDGNRIMSAGEEPGVRLWDRSGERLIAALPGMPRTAIFSADGKRILIGGVPNQTAGTPCAVTVWDAVTGRSVCTVAKEGAGYALSPDGRRVLIDGPANTAVVCDADTGRHLLTLRGHTLYVNCGVFSPDGKRILTSTWGEVKLWDAETGREMLSLQGCYPAQFSPDGQTIVAATAHTGKDYDPPDGPNIRVWRAAAPELGAGQTADARP